MISFPSNNVCPNKRVDYSDDLNNVEVFSFLGCTWKYADPNQEGSGGAINIDHSRKKPSNQSLYIIRCSFLNSNLTKYDLDGGAFYTDGIGTFNLSSSVFQNLSSKNTGGGVAWDTNLCLLIHNCSFNTCTATDEVGALNIRDFGHYLDSTCLSHSSYGSIFGCSFLKCFAGGSIGAFFSSSFPLIGSMRSCVFESCHSTREQGAVVIAFARRGKNDVIFYYCFFNNNTCGRACNRTDIWLRGLENNPYNSTSPIVLSYSTTPPNFVRCYYFYEDKSKWLSDAPSPFNQFDYPYSDSSPGVDSFGCGISCVYPCKTRAWLETHEVKGVTVIPTYCLTSSSSASSSSSSASSYSSVDSSSLSSS
jgi:hypothetical protein